MVDQSKDEVEKKANFNLEAKEFVPDFGQNFFFSEEKSAAGLRQLEKLSSNQAYDDWSTLEHKDVNSKVDLHQAAYWSAKDNSMSIETAKQLLEKLLGKNNNEKLNEVIDQLYSVLVDKKHIDQLSHDENENFRKLDKLIVQVQEKNLQIAQESINDAIIVRKYGEKLKDPERFKNHKGANVRKKHELEAKELIEKAIRFMPTDHQNLDENLLHTIAVAIDGFEKQDKSVPGEDEAFKQMRKHLEMLGAASRLCKHVELKYLDGAIERIEQRIKTGKSNLTSVVAMMLEDPFLSTKMYYQMWETNLEYHYQARAKWLDMLFFRTLVSTSHRDYYKLDQTYKKLKETWLWEPLERELTHNKNIKDSKEKLDKQFCGDGYRPAFLEPSSETNDEANKSVQSKTSTAQLAISWDSNPFVNVQLVSHKLTARTVLEKGKVIFSEPLLALKWCQGLFCVNCFKKLPSMMHLCDTCPKCTLGIFCSKQCAKVAKANSRHAENCTSLKSPMCLSRNGNLVYQLVCWFGLEKLLEVPVSPDPSVPNSPKEFRFNLASLLFNKSMFDQSQQEPVDYALLLDTFLLMKLLQKNPEISTESRKIMTNLYKWLFSLKYNPSVNSPLVEAMSQKPKGGKAKKRSIVGNGLTALGGSFTFSCKANTFRQFNSEKGVIEYVAAEQINQDKPLELPWGLSKKKFPLDSKDRAEEIFGRFKVKCTCEACKALYSNKSESASAVKP